VVVFKQKVTVCVLVCGWGFAQAQTAPVTEPIAATQGQRNIAVAKAQFDINRYRIEGNSLLGAPAISALLARYTGTQRSFDEVAQAAAALKAAYAEAGYPIVQVSVPEQSVANGEVTLQVVEGKLSNVISAGNSTYDLGNLRASLPPLKEGSAVNTKDLVAAITLANENPAKQVAVNFAAGSAPGLVDARIDVVEDRQTKTSITADNMGSNATGRTRIGVGYQNANGFNRDHQFGLQYMTTAEQPADVKNLVGSYHIPLYTLGLSLDLVGSYSDSQSITTAPIGQLLFAGKGVYLAGRLNQTLAGVGELRHKIAYGIDYKDFANTCGVAGTDLPSCGSVSALPAGLSYVFQYATPAVQAGGSVGLVKNIPGGPHGSDAEYTAARSGAVQSWSAYRISAFAGVPLGADWQLRGQIAGQSSPDNLVPAEQYGIGGGSSVRGYEERVAAGDVGYNASLELYSPDFGQAIGGANTHLRALVFYDMGSVRKNNPLITETDTKLASAGLGLRLNIGKDTAAKLDVGWIRDAAGTRAANQASGTVSLSYAF
jgi:hemolysin activation/secretion protein